MIILGVVLLIVGWATGIGLLYVLGAILAVVGAVLLFVPSIGGGRRFY